MKVTSCLSLRNARVLRRNVRQYIDAEIVGKTTSKCGEKIPQGVENSAKVASRMLPRFALFCLVFVSCFVAFVCVCVCVPV